MSDVSEKLEAIRKKFVGSGEEHDLLGKLVADYRKAYDDGYEYGRKELESHLQSEAEDLKFARVICALTNGAYALFNPGDIPDYSLQSVADWLKGTGKTACSLRKIADLIESSTQPPEAK